MYKHYITLFILLTIGFSFTGKSQIVISEIVSDSLIELHNQGVDTIDINDYWLCNRPQYDRIGSLNAICGSFDMEPGSYLVINSNFSMSGSGDELGIYSSGDFADSLSIVDYVIWGDRNGSTRESVAVSAGIWTNGERASAFDENNSLLYDGEGDSASDFYLGASNQCAQNIPPCEVSGGNITTDSGQTQTSLCVDDGLVETITVSLSGQSGTNSAWIVTDTALKILEIDTSNFFEFEEAGPGICLIWHLSFEEGLTGAVVDSNAANLSGCFALSNSIEVTRLSGEDCPIAPTCEVEGGSIVNQDSTVISTVCIDDNMEELVIITLSGATGQNNAFVVTDTNQMILTIEENTNVFNLEPTGLGVSLIWNISYQDSLIGLQNGSNIGDVTGCFALSNSVQVNRIGGSDCPMQTCEVVAGSIVNQEGTTLSTNCVSDDVEDLIIVSLTNGTGSEGLYIVTDTNSVILLVETNTNVFNLEPFGEGTSFLWHITFDGNIEGVIRGNSISDISGCFALSNSIEVNRFSGTNCPGPPCDAAGGTITTEDGSTEVTICTDNDITESLAIDLVDASGTNSIWVITDTIGNIIELDSSNIFTFDSSALDVCLIWHLSYEDGIMGAVVDSNAANISGCFSVSNPITVTKVSGDDCPAPPCEVSAGILALAEGGTTTTICTGDGISDSFEITIDSAQGTNEGWIITDTAGIILGLPMSPPFDLENEGVGTCLIWHIVSDGPLTGVTLDANANDIGGCFALSNPITVIRVAGDDCPEPPCEVSAGTIAIDSQTELTICLSDSGTLEADLTGNTGSNSAWVVTDTNLTIVSIDTSNVFNFDSTDQGVCLIWHLSFEEGLSGAEIDSNASNLSGCFELSNAITVRKVLEDECPTDECVVSAGVLTLSDGLTSLEICADDGISDSFEVSIDSAQGANEAWLITDTSGVIIGLPMSPPFDLEGQGPGTCLIWHIAFNDTLSGLALGANASEISGCYALSNSISVVRLTGEDCPPPPCDVSGGIISLEDGTNEISICADDAEGNNVAVNLTDQSGSNSAWVTTDTNLTILNIDTSSSLNFDSIEAGVCLIWHISFEDGLVGAQIDSNASNLSGCFSLSNSITVTKLSGDDCPLSNCSVAGGTLTTANGNNSFVVCGGTATPSLIDVMLTENVGSRSAWLITDTAGIILGFPLSPPFNLTGANVGSYQIWHLSYDGSIIGASLGADAQDLEGCLALSNPINIERVDIHPSTISLMDSSDVAEICIGSNMSESLEVISMDGSGPLKSWVVTDTSGVIISLPSSGSIDFSEAGSGTCLVWQIDHASDLSGLIIGQNVDGLSGCYALSNSITVVRTVVEGGSLMTDIGTAAIEICVSDSIEDAVELFLTNNQGANGSYLLTDTLGTILEISETVDFDFENDSLSICQIWYISYEDGLTGLNQGSQVESLSGCFDLSNAVTITKVSGDDCPEPCTTDGGRITSLDGETEITICVDDNIADNFDLMVEGAEGDFFGYVVTDEDNNILGIEETFRVNLEGTGAGKILVRYIAYDAMANIPEEGGNINTLSGCYSLSNIFTINRVIEDECFDVCAADGGQITINGATELSICSDDGESDEMTIDLSNNAGDNSQFVLTNDENEIISVLASNMIDLEGTESGVCIIWHISYNDSISGVEMGGNLDDLEGCLSISNPVSIVKTTGFDCPGSCSTDGGSISTLEGEDALDFCAGEVMFSVVHETTSEDSMASYWYVITDEGGSILQWQNSTDGGNFDLSRDPGGICLVYGFSTLDSTILEEDINITELLVGCGVLSNNFITITKSVGGECDEGCHTPRDIRLKRSSGSNTWTVRWDRVDEATGFTVLIGYEGNPNSFSEVPVRRNRITLTGPPNRTMVVRIRTECRFGEQSEYTREYVLVESASDFRTNLSETRSRILQHGTVLPNGIVISEQALAFPNPATDQITIWHDADGQIGQVSIFDQTGKLMIEKRLLGDEEFQSVDVSNLNNGFYFILVQSQGELILQDKLVIQNGR